GGQRDAAIGCTQSVANGGRRARAIDGDDAAAAQRVGQLDDAYADIRRGAQPLVRYFGPGDEPLQFLADRGDLVLDDVAVDGRNADDGGDQHNGGNNGDLDQGKALLAVRQGGGMTGHAKYLIGWSNNWSGRSAFR